MKSLYWSELNFKEEQVTESIEIIQISKRSYELFCALLGKLHADHQQTEQLDRKFIPSIPYSIAVS